MLDEIDIAGTEVRLDRRAECRRNPLRFRFSAHPLVSQVSLTGGTSFLTSAAAILTISLVGRELGPALLGEYLLVRRMASWLQAVVALPSGVALPRYVAASVEEPPSTSQSYFLGSIVTACALALLLTALFLLWKSAASRLLFGSAEMTPLLFPLGLMMLGLATHGSAFGFYQGKLMMGSACSLQLLNLAVWPILAVVVLTRERSIPLLVGSTGSLMAVCALLFSIPILQGIKREEVAHRALDRVRDLFCFGLSRAWGDFGLQAWFSLPPIIAAHSLPMKSVSFLLLGGSFLALVASATLPLGVILLSQVTRSIAQGRTAQLQTQLSHFVAALLESSIFVSLQLVVFAEAILMIWVGPSFESAVGIVQMLILAVPFYFLYGGLRSVLDAGAIKAYNTRNILISLAVFLLTTLVVKLCVSDNHLLPGLALSIDVSIVALAGLTIHRVRQLFDLRISWPRLLPGIAFGVALGAVSFFLTTVFHFRPHFLTLLFYEVSLSALYGGGLWLSGSPWLRFLVSRAFSVQSLNRQAVE
jgi:O-antigen/teichoic acid export membrane protein